ncbi:MAG: type IV pilin protein [Halobacteria archaeon]|nr:type IV pilin protein [Halobacteria archaeon]
MTRDRYGARTGTGGFTLVELMAVLLIIAVISGLAWPAYREQVMKTRRSNGMAALVELAAHMELYYADHGTYAGATLGPLTGNLFPATTPGGHYRLAITAQNDLYYVISATPANQGNPQRDRCGTFTLDSLGNRGLSAHATGISQCWR